MAVSWSYVNIFVWILDIWTRYLDQDNFEPGLQSDFKSEVCSVHLSGLGQTRGRPGKFQTFLFPLVHYVTHWRSLLRIHLDFFYIVLAQVQKVQTSAWTYFL